MIKYIVFDFDGTLADTFEIIKKITKEEIKDISDEDFELVRDEGIKNAIKRKGILVWQLPKLVLDITSKLKNEKDAGMFPGMMETIKTLSNSYKLGIVSSNSEENIIRNLKKHNIATLFNFVFSQSSIFGKHVTLRRMCKKYQLNPSEIIYIGDEDRDIIAAKKVKIKNIAVTWGYNSEKRLKKVDPDIIVNSPKEIIEKLSRS